MRLNRSAPAVFAAFWAVLLLAFAPAGADEEREEPAGQATTCRDVLDGSPGYEVEQTTDPPQEGEVRAGDPIAVRMVWAAEDFTGAPLYDVLSCVTVDGALEDALGIHEHASPNRGEFRHRFLIPGMIRPGAQVCVRGAVAGDGGGYFERNISDDVCLTMVEDQAPSDENRPPPEPTPVPPAPASPTPSAPRTVAGPPETLPAANPAPMETPTVAGITAIEERGAEASAPQIQERLPRTGPTHRLPLALAGLLLAVGGAIMTMRPRAD